MMLGRYAFSLESHECARSDGVNTLREVQIACSVELAWLSWLRRKTTGEPNPEHWGIGIIFVRVDFKVSRVVVITPVPAELAAVNMDHSISSIRSCVPMPLSSC